MKVAAIIVNYNDEEETLQYVNKIQKYNVIHRIVVVDNLSTTTGAFQKLKQLENEKVAVIQSQKNGGYGYGNNFGIHYLEQRGETYDAMIISNPDIIVEETAILHCLEILENYQEVAVVAPRMFNKENKPIRRSAWKIRTFGLDVIHATRILEIIFYKYLRKGEYTKEDFEQEELEVEAISGAFFIIKTEVLKEIGLLDENVFLFYEEDILAKRLKEKKYKIISLNSETFIHYESQTIGKAMNYYQKVKQLHQSKMYYHKQYNHIYQWQEIVFQVLYGIRKVELLIEIPVRKLFNK